MEDIKSFLVYFVALVGLVGASLLFANQGEPPEIKPPPAATVPVEEISQAATTDEAVGSGKCADTAQGLIFAYVPDASPKTGSKNDRLFISGAIYASDGVTPLPGALVKVKQASSFSEGESYTPSSQARTNANGRYTLITTKSQPHLVLTVHYQDQVNYQNTCLLLIRLNVVSMPLSKSPFLKNTGASSPARTTLPAGQITEAGPVFHGPVDIVLPVPPPLSE